MKNLKFIFACALIFNALQGSSNTTPENNNQEFTLDDCHELHKKILSRLSDMNAHASKSRIATLENAIKQIEHLNNAWTDTCKRKDGTHYKEGFDRVPVWAHVIPGAMIVYAMSHKLEPVIAIECSRAIRNFQEIIEKGKPQPDPEDVARARMVKIGTFMDENLKGDLPQYQRPIDVR